MMMITVPVERPAARPALRRRLQHSERRALLLAGDAAAALLSALVALWLWSIPAGGQFTPAFVADKAWWFAAAACWFLLAALPTSSLSAVRSIRGTMLAFARAAALFLLGYLVLYFYAPRGELPRLVALYFVWEAILLSSAWRLVFVAVFDRPQFRPRALVVGTPETADVASRVLAEYGREYADVVGLVLDDAPRGAAPAEPGAFVPAELPDVVESLAVSELILALRHRPDEALLRSLVVCQEAGIQLVRLQTLYEHLLGRIPVDLIDADWLLTDLADAVRARDASWRGKRIVDVAGAIVGLVFFAALCPLIALAIALESGRPVFYRQRRVGLGGAPFTVTKFRTMVHGAERPGEVKWAQARDPRITRVGRVLRRLRFDEWPQLLSVLRGEMSLVGPRPEREEFVRDLEERIPFYRARLMVPPGLTGWAQVNLPYADSVASARMKLEYDLYYVKHRTAAFDMQILLRTIGTVLRARGV